MSDILDLRQRVEAAEKKFGVEAEKQSKYSQRLIALVSAVETSAQTAKIEHEETSSALLAAKSENEQLRGMLLTLLLAIEQESDDIAPIMKDLERTIVDLSENDDASAIEVAEAMDEDEAAKAGVPELELAADDMGSADANEPFALETADEDPVTEDAGLASVSGAHDEVDLLAETAAEETTVSLSSDAHAEDQELVLAEDEAAGLDDDELADLLDDADTLPDEELSSEEQAAEQAVHEETAEQEFAQPDLAAEDSGDEDLAVEFEETSLEVSEVAGDDALDAETADSLQEDLESISLDDESDSIDIAFDESIDEDEAVDLVADAEEEAVELFTPEDEGVADEGELLDESIEIDMEEVVDFESLDVEQPEDDPDSLVEESFDEDSAPSIHTMAEQLRQKNESVAKTEEHANEGT